MKKMPAKETRGLFSGTLAVLKSENRASYMLGLVSTAWLPFGFGAALVDLFQGQFTLLRLLASTVELIVFSCIYLWAVWGNTRKLVAGTTPITQQTQTSTWLTIAVLALLSLIMVLSNGKNWGSGFIFTSVYAASLLSVTEATWTIIALTLLTALISRLLSQSWYDFGWAVFVVAMTGTIVTSMRESIRANQKLRVAREEIAHLAVTTERLRIARDLHDLLGHNLSLIALKSELAGRLLNTAPERAAVEIADVEHVARTTLQEVREAVGNYRQPGLANELQGAEEILAAAGIAYRYEQNESIMGTLPATIEAVLSWAVREGVTNVIRHSRAQHCTIHVMHNEQSVHTEIIDDGSKMAPESQEETVRGNGLCGLAERVDALGGHFEAGRGRDGGFRLAISIPLAQKAELPSVMIASTRQQTPIAQVEHASSIEERSIQR